MGNDERDYGDGEKVTYYVPAAYPVPENQPLRRCRAGCARCSTSAAPGV